MATKALEISVMRGEHERRRKEYTDRGIGTMRDGCLIKRETRLLLLIAFNPPLVSLTAT